MTVFLNLLLKVEFCQPVNFYYHQSCKSTYSKIQGFDCVEKLKHAHWHAQTLKKQDLKWKWQSRPDMLSSCENSFFSTCCCFRRVSVLLLSSTLLKKIKNKIKCLCPRSPPGPAEAMKAHMKAFAPTALHKYCTTQTCLANLHVFLLSDSSINKHLGGFHSHK